MMDEVEQGGRATMETKKIKERVEQRRDMIFARVPLDDLPIEQLFAGHVDDACIYSDLEQQEDEEEEEHPAKRRSARPT